MSDDDDDNKGGHHHKIATFLALVAAGGLAVSYFSTPHSQGHHVGAAQPEARGLARGVGRGHRIRVHVGSFDRAAAGL